MAFQLAVTPFSVAPRNGVYFAASTSGATANWKAITVANNAMSMKDTAIATSTTFHRYRVEVTTGQATFLIDGKVVATIGSNMPTTALLNYEIGLGKFVAGPAA